MHWVLESNLLDFGYQWLIKNLESKRIGYTLVKVVPYEDILLDPNFNTFGAKPSHDDNIKLPNKDEVKLFPFGTMGLSRVAKLRDWNPGSLFNDNFDYKIWSKGFGKENLLNEDSKVIKIKDNIIIKDSIVFIRPCADDKSFSGKVISRDEFYRWKQSIIDSDQLNPKLNSETEITVAPYKEIQQETRMFVLDNKVITGSYYKIGPKVIYKEVLLGDPVIDYTNEVIKGFEPAKAYVIDIAKTVDGYKIIEINNINSVGLYHADVDKFVNAVMDTFS